MTALAASICLLAACDSGDPVNLQGRPAPGRAVLNPFYNSASNDEVFSRNSGAMTLLTVDFPNDKDGTAQVHSVVDDIASITGKAPATEPATRSSTQPVAVEPGGAGTDEIKIADQAKSGDSITVTRDNEANADLWIVSATGTGTVTLQRTGESWPPVVRVHLNYEEDKPFTHVADLTAMELSGERQLTLKVSVDTNAAKGQISIPAFSRAPQILVQWTGASRQFGGDTPTQEHLK